MKSRLVQSIFIVATLFIGTTSQAQTNKPKMPEAVRDLIKFIGIWESDATITIDSVPHKVTYRMNFRKTADGFGMNMDEGYTDSLLGSLRSANLVGYNSNDSLIHWSYIDNMGNTRESHGKWTDSDNLRFQYDSKRNGKKYSEIITYSFHGNDEFTYKLSAFLESKETKKITGKFKRKQMAVPVPKK